MSESYFIYYRVAPQSAAAVLAAVQDLQRTLLAKAGVSGRLLCRQDEPQTWMEVYEHVPDVEDFETVRSELARFQPTLAAKPQIVAANKIDALDYESRAAQLGARASSLELPFFRISGATGAGLRELLESAWKTLGATRHASGVEDAIAQSAGPLTQ